MKPIDPNNLRAADSETYRFRPGLSAPPLVCGSVAEIRGGEIVGELLTPVEWINRLRQYLVEGRHIAFANAAYDLCVAAEHDHTLLVLIFWALDRGLIIDTLIVEALHAIWHGHLGKEENGSPLRDSEGEVRKRYSLDIVTKLVLGRTNAKEDDDFRESYALLAPFPMPTWPPKARKYPVDDASNTLEVAIAQLYGVKGKHDWVEVPPIPNVSRGMTICRHCKGELTMSWPAATDRCDAAPLIEHQNLDDVAAQVDADFCFKLGAAHSFRTDPVRVAALAEEVEKKHAEFVKRFQSKKWIRENGSEDQAAVKRAIALAYGAKGTCPRCAGGCPCRKCDATGSYKGMMCPDCEGAKILVGKVQQWKQEPCRGHKVNGRYPGCTLASDCRCKGTGFITVPGSATTCKNVYDSDDNTVEFGCDGTGLDLGTAPLLPRTKNKEHPRRLGGIATDRDTCMESGDDDISDYGENEFEKSRSTYLPYLRTGLTGPLKYSPNVIVATGRGSIEDSPLHQMPRAGKERKCIRARGAWCGVPIEYILGSTDYEAGELCTLSQFTYWLFGYSQMRDAINRSGKPGILHSDLASEVLGISLDEFLVRLKSKNQQAIDFRQMCKPINFGVPGRMGVPKLVLTSRKKNAGFTPCEFGPARNEGVPGYWGVRFCVLAGVTKRCGEQKILKWKGQDCAPVCKACCKVVDEILLPAYDRKYPEIRKDYFRWCDKMMDDHLPAPTAIWDPEAGKPRIVRERMCESPSEFSNNGFQSLLATIGKHAFCRATRECYLGVKPDGSPSPLYGSRLPIYLHDEPLSELRLDSFQQAGPRIAEIMVASGKLLAPDVVWKAETAAAFWWDKKMEPEYDKQTGLLMPWGPIPEEHQHRFRAAA